MEKQKLNLKNKAIKRQTKCAHKGNLISQPPVQRVSLLRVALTSGWGAHLNHLEVEIEREQRIYDSPLMSSPNLTQPVCSFSSSFLLWFF